MLTTSKKNKVEFNTKNPTDIKHNSILLFFILISKGIRELTRNKGSVNDFIIKEMMKTGTPTILPFLNVLLM